MTAPIFQRLGIYRTPIMLAPLAGVSDHPFRRTCASQGADLTYVEMISATALVYGSKKTFAMLKRHTSEAILGVQVTGRNADETAQAIAILDREPFDTIDINMGCPVNKVVKAGCGSAILKDPHRVAETVRKARAATDKPLSVKVRLGWDRGSINILEVAQAAAESGADWITVHGRTRADDYAVAVDLDHIAQVKQRVTIPVIGNGNIFSVADAQYMQSVTGIDGVMISRGALGNPWIFRDIHNGTTVPVSRDDWVRTVLTHLDAQQEEYGAHPGAAVCMRKHLLWYTKGWPGNKKWRERINNSASLIEARLLITEYAAELVSEGNTVRNDIGLMEAGQRFQWDPKYDMDRQLDRGVGDDGLESNQIV